MKEIFLFRGDKCLTIIITVICLAFGMVSGSLCITDTCRAKTKWVAVYSTSGNKITYKNTGIIYESDNSYPRGKKKNIRKSNSIKYYWFYSKGEGLKYKRLSESEFEKKFKKETANIGFQICRMIIKNGKAEKVYGEYQA